MFWNVLLYHAVIDEHLELIYDQFSINKVFHEMKCNKDDEI